MRQFTAPALLALLLPVASPAQIMRGRVTMPDGSAPPQRAIIERVCYAGNPIQEAITGKKGEFFWRVPNDGLSLRMNGISLALRCVLRARVKDLTSDGIDVQDPRVLSNLQLPTMVLGAHKAEESDSLKLPRAAVKTWEAATSAYRAGRWEEAERAARDVARQAPQFAPAWTAIGVACTNEKKLPEAREALQRAIVLDAESLTSRLQLARVEIAMEHWEEAARTAEVLIDQDRARRYAEAYLILGNARYMLGETGPARASWQKYLEIAPNSPNVTMVKAKLEELSRPVGAPVTPVIPDALLAPATEPEFTAGGEAWVPGGRKALAAIARLPNTPEPANFFLEYCRAIAAHTSHLTEHPIPGYAAALQAYIGSVAELAALGDRHEDRTAITLSPGDEMTARVLGLLGWKMVRGNGAVAVEPGDQPTDGPRQQIPKALGIDEFAMQQALQAGRSFGFETPTENAALAGGAAWGAILQSFATLPGGIAEAFIRDVRLAKVYAGLGAMQPEIARALVKDIGLRTLAAAHADTLWLYGDTFRAEVVPGGAAAEPVWEKLAGRNPRDGARFFGALLRADRGRLAAFYASLAHAGAARQKFFTKDAGRAERFYAWYRESDEWREGSGWRSRFLQTLPLDDSGRVRFPGGIQAWSGNAAASDDEALWPPGPAPVNFEALGSIARLEQERGAALDTESAKLLARNFAEWRPLFPYFTALSRLGAAEFRALESFANQAAALPHAAREQAMGAWHSAAALIVLGRKAGSFDDGAAARAFGRLCSPDDRMALLREIAGSAANLDDAVAGGLLRLTGGQRAAFERVRELQHAPRLATLDASSGAAAVVAALSGAVYAAVLNPDTLLVAEDDSLLRKHVFVPGRTALFAPAALAGTHFTGGFMNFEATARSLSRAGGAIRQATEAAAGEPAAPGPSDLATDTLFRANARLVEVHTSVTDARGRHIDGLRAEQFTVLDRGRRMRVAAFENGAAALSCVLLLDTSQSMEAALPALKSAAPKLIAGLRQDDAVAVYSLNGGGIAELQPFTTDKAAAARAVFGAELGELTALYDGLVRVNRDMALRTGKKVIVVFTDGEDNASALSAETAILRAKTAGVPIYTIAQGHALRHSSLLKELGGMAQATGGLSFTIQSAAEIGPVFESVLEDLLHGYLLAFQPPDASDHEWRDIGVRLNAPARGKVRAREGYFPE